MLTNNRVYILRVRVILKLIFCTSFGVHKKPSPRLQPGIF